MIRVGGIQYIQGDVILGTKRQNPYSVTNMASAYSSILRKGISSNKPVSIRNTHYYVKFKPQNLDQYEVLSRDSTLSLSDYPIEYTIVQNGNRYHDPSLPADVSTYQYAAVKVGYTFKDTISHQIIDNLYIPEEDNTISGTSNKPFVDKLLDEAYIRTGNYEDTVKFDSQNPARRYNPAGKIQLFDTRIGALIGMEGVRVQARRWFLIYSATTDFNGNYRMNNSYKRDCNYSIWFATTRFSIREHLFSLTSYINGPKQSGDWSYDINNGYDRFVGHIFRGAFRYHNKDIGGLQRPDRWLGKRTLYIGKDSYGSSSGINYIILPILKIWRYKDAEQAEYSSDEIFSTTCHETGHTSHVITMNAGPIQYIQVSRQLQESWAIAIEWFITHIEYANRGIANYGESDYHPANFPQYPNDQAYQYWNLTVNNTYTNLFINLVDRTNEFNQNYPGWGINIINDQVAGYDLASIEQNILKHSYGLSSLNTQLKSNKPAGVTDAQIDLLLSHY